MPEDISFHSRTRGSFGDKDDWYRLQIKDDGSQFVEHQWSYTNPFRIETYGADQELVPLAEFLLGDYDQNAQEKLREILTGAPEIETEMSGT